MKYSKLKLKNVNIVNKKIVLFRNYGFYRLMCQNYSFTCEIY